MISVCMATYNGERYLKSQIDSILSQLSDEDELIISDDGSTDKTLSLIGRMVTSDKRIKLLNHKREKKFDDIKHSKSFYLASSNFENALKEAKGDYIFLSDQDDIWAENKISHSISALKNYNLVISNYAIIDENGETINPKFLKDCPVSTKSLFQNVLKSKFLGCTMAFTKTALDKALPFPNRLIAHDLWIGCLNYKDMFFIDEVLQLYRRHGDNVSTSSGKSSNRLWYRLAYRIKILGQLVLRNKRRFI